MNRRQALAGSLLLGLAAGLGRFFPVAEKPKVVTSHVPYILIWDVDDHSTSYKIEFPRVKYRREMGPEPSWSLDGLKITEA